MLIDLTHPPSGFRVPFFRGRWGGRAVVLSLVLVVGMGVVPARARPETVKITVDPMATRPISPWIYGINGYGASSTQVRNLALHRHGGNRWTAYNWETNASNAGKDWFFHNDDHLGGGDVPGQAVYPLLLADRSRGKASLFTVPMLGYVAADKKGDNVALVTPIETRLATRFKRLVPQKPVATAGPFTLSPDTRDAYVYADEFVWAMDQRVDGDIYADPLRPTFISLDNEPDLWSDTHSPISPTAPTPQAFIDQTITMAKAIKDVAPAAKLFGPGHYGFLGLTSWQGAPGFSSTFWYADLYLRAMRTASSEYGRRLVDVFDFHWYSEVYVGGKRVTDFDAAWLNDDQIQGIVQSPRSLWDPTYTEDSWIARSMGAPIRLLPRLQEKIAVGWPGTELAVTEWNHGGANHIAGAIAVADTLGIFGQYGVFAAAYWPLNAQTNFDHAGFRMYRDYDGALGTFGDLSIAATSSGPARVAAYVSRNSALPGRYVIVAINRSATEQTVGFRGLKLCARARLFRLSGDSNQPKPVGVTAEVDLADWLVDLPGYSITTIELTDASRSVP